MPGRDLEKSINRQRDNAAILLTLLLDIVVDQFHRFGELRVCESAATHTGYLDGYNSGSLSNADVVSSGFASEWVAEEVSEWPPPLQVVSIC